MKTKKTTRLVFAAFFLSLGLVLPFLTAQIKEIGDTLLPMHLPVMLCGMVCGPVYGATVGLVLPFLRSLLFGMPPLYPAAVWMSLELATYGAVLGVLYYRAKKKSVGYTYFSLVCAMLAGRVVWGVTKAILLGVADKPFGFSAFIVGGFVDAVPGIIVQLILIPLIVKTVFERKNKSEKEENAVKEITFPYGKQGLSYKFKDGELLGVLESSINEYTPECSEEELVRRALAAPVGTGRLCELAKGKKNVVIIASDHTRPVPSKVIIPAMLEEIRSAAPEAEITILIATGCHRGTTKDELVSKFGEEIVARENIYVHDCDEREKLVNIGKLPSGGDCEVNSIAYNADLLVAEGFIEPHFFAGFSGGRKSVLPGVCGRSTVLANHCSEFIAHPCARTGILSGNPIHEDMLWAAKQAKLAFIVNVVLNEDKKVIYATAGDSEAAHKAGTDFIASLCEVKALDADVVITTNGGYPLDQNVYQAVKGMTAAEATVKEGGVIIMLAASNDGMGGDHFYRQMAECVDLKEATEGFLARSRSQTLPDQWMSQILVRILTRATVVYVSEMPDDIIKQMHMLPAHSIDEALEIAKRTLGKQDVGIVAIPDGVSVMVKR